MDADREERMEALRARVRAKKEAALNGEPEEELVVSTADLTVQSAADEAADEWYAMIDAMRTDGETSLLHSSSSGVCLA